MIIFLDIETFKTFVKTGGESDTEIVNTVWKNLILKWTYPLDSGNIRFDSDASLGPNEDQGAWVSDRGRVSNEHRGSSRTVLPKPVMLTGTADKLVAKGYKHWKARFDTTLRETKGDAQKALEKIHGKDSKQEAD